MKQNNVLVTGFEGGPGDGHTTEDLLARLSNRYDKLLFTNDLMIDKEKIIQRLSKKNYDYIIMFGYKPLLKGLSIELECVLNNEYLYTNFPFAKILTPLKEHNIKYRISENPGNSYCNFTYYHTLKYIKEHNLNTKVIFIHVPHIKEFKQFEELVEMMNELKEN